MTISAITLICESIRQEADGGFTLIGVKPNNFNLQKDAPVLGNYAFFTRIVSDIKRPPKSIKATLTNTDNSILFETMLDEGTINQVINQIKKDDSEQLLFNLNLAMNGIPNVGEGNIISKIEIDGSVMEAGRFKISYAEQNAV